MLGNNTHCIMQPTGVKANDNLSAYAGLASPLYRILQGMGESCHRQQNSQPRPPPYPLPAPLRSEPTSREHQRHVPGSAMIGWLIAAKRRSLVDYHGFHRTHKGDEG